MILQVCNYKPKPGMVEAESKSSAQPYTLEAATPNSCKPPQGRFASDAQTKFTVRGTDEVNCPMPSDTKGSISLMKTSAFVWGGGSGSLRFTV